jgi:hypothetical protein
MRVNWRDDAKRIRSTARVLLALAVRAATTAQNGLEDKTVDLYFCKGHVAVKFGFLNKLLLRG